MVFSIHYTFKPSCGEEQRLLFLHDNAGDAVGQDAGQERRRAAPGTTAQGSPAAAPESRCSASSAETIGISRKLTSLSYEDYVQPPREIISTCMVIEFKRLFESCYLESQMGRKFIIDTRPYC